MTRPAGWYEDPEDPDNLRYFDGVEWSGPPIPRTKPDLDRSGIGAPRWSPPQQEQPGTYRPAPGIPGGWQQPGPSAYRTAAPATADGQPLSGWWRRVLAVVLDWVIVSILSLPFVWIPYQQVLPQLQGWWEDMLAAARAGSTQAPQLPQELFGALALMSVIVFAVYAVYEVAFLVRSGATPGKMAAGISVRLAERPGPPPLRAAALRVLVKEGPTALGGVPLISTLALLFQIADRLWPLWDRQRQSVHDKVAATVVVVGRQKRPR